MAITSNSYHAIVKDGWKKFVITGQRFHYSGKDNKVSIVFDNYDQLVRVYNMKRKKEYSIKVKDLKVAEDLLWYKGQYYEIMKIVGTIKGRGVRVPYEY